jgi:hypothetical protein
MGNQLTISFPGDFEPTLKGLIEKILNEAEQPIKAKLRTLVY